MNWHQYSKKVYEIHFPGLMSDPFFIKSITWIVININFNLVEGTWMILIACTFYGAFFENSKCSKTEHLVGPNT